MTSDVTGDVTGPGSDRSTEQLLREHAPQVLGILARRFSQFDACEDAVQEASLAATTQWSANGVPDNPRGWLLTVATRRLTDEWRSESARRRREVDLAERERPILDGAWVSDADDSLALLFLCCHPDLTSASQICLTLRAVGGLTTAEIAAAFLVPETTMAQRISRAKQRIRATAPHFAPTTHAEAGARLEAVLRVLYLIFNEGYTATSGAALSRSELSDEAIRLTRLVLEARPDDGEAAGLLALMLLTDARRPARAGPDGELIPLADQDRTRWRRPLIAEALGILERTLSRAATGPYQLQAAIAAVHAEAARSADTDWAQIAALYGILNALDDNPMVTLNRAVAVAMVDGPEAGLGLLTALDSDDRVNSGHRLPAVRAHLLEQSGRMADALAEYREAARRATSVPEQRYLRSRADRIAGPVVSPGRERGH